MNEDKAVERLSRQFSARLEVWQIEHALKAQGFRMLYIDWKTGITEFDYVTAHYVRENEQ